MNSRIASGFDRLAPIYDLGGRLLFGRALHKSTVALIEDLAFSEQALIVGAGTGRFLCELALSGRAGRILCLDVSRGLLTRAERRYLDAGLDPERVEFVHAPVEQLPSNLRFDLICTNYFLDLYATSELTQIVERLSGNLAARGLWYFTDFVDGSAWRVRLSYRFFAIVCGIRARRVPDYKRAFAQGGMTPILAREHGRGLMRTMILRKTGFAAGWR